MQKLDIDWPRENLRSNNKVKFKKKHKRVYGSYLKSPLCLCNKIWEMLPSEVQ